MEKIVIGLAGAAGSGKSTAAEELERQGFTRIRFADPLKNMMRALYLSVGLSSSEIERRIEGDLKEVPDPILRGVTPRQAMQRLGTEWGRNLIADDLWTSLWARRAAECALVVAEDCRFENEAETLRAEGGRIVKIDCPWAASASGSGHVSEAGVAADVVIANDRRGEPEPFLASLRAATGQLGERPAPSSI